MQKTEHKIVFVSSGHTTCDAAYEKSLGTETIYRQCSLPGTHTRTLSAEGLSMCASVVNNANVNIAVNSNTQFRLCLLHVSSTPLCLILPWTQLQSSHRARTWSSYQETVHAKQYVKSREAYNALAAAFANKSLSGPAVSVKQAIESAIDDYLCAHRNLTDTTSPMRHRAGPASLSYATSPSNFVTRNLVGFPNTRNFCFMNAALQCFCSIRPLCDWFSSATEAETGTSGLSKDLALLTVFVTKQSQHMFSEHGTLRDILNRISQGVPTTGGQTFSGGGQHDTMEFFNAILATLKDTGSLPSVSGIVSQTFQGFNKNVRQCVTCSYKFVNMESNMCLSLPIVRVDAKSSETTLEKCIESYLQVRSMSLCKCSTGQLQDATDSFILRCSCVGKDAR